MAVTGNFYNTLEFGGINSGDYGVYITGTGVYNAPARAVEMVSVPGRNGDVPIDMGHWDNIEVTYKCGLFGVDQSEMGEALMEFRNAIASQIGYQRLSDSYNPNEFRLGLFMAGLEFDAVSRNRAGEFELKFNCKPQRFLTDGEEMIDVRTDWGDLKTASGEVVTFEVADDAAANYTQFKSLIADIEPVQSGSGTPSPDNVRPISGWDSVEVVVSPTTSAEDGTTHTATFDETVYGGTVDLVSGVLNSKPYYASYNGETLTGEWISDRDEYVEGTTPTIGAQVVNIGADGTDSQLSPQTINTLVGENNVWANSGDVSLEYGVRPGVLINPTQYESQPLIEIGGAGTVALNDYIIEVEDIVLGDVIVAPAMSLESAGYRQISKNVNLENGLLNIGDSFMVSNVVWRDVINMVADSKSTITGTATCTGIDGATAEVVADWEPSGISSAPWRPLQGAKITIPKMEFVFGTAKTYTLTATASGTRGPSSWNFTTTTTISYDGGSRIVYAWDTTSVGGNRLNAEVPATNGDSTVRATDGEVIIDSETGDAYAIQGGTYISLNKYIQLGAQLPTLRPGVNVITYDDTITSLKIAPRWWRL